MRIRKVGVTSHRDHSPRVSVTERVRAPPSLSVFPRDADHVPHSGLIGIIQTQTEICR